MRKHALMVPVLLLGVIAENTEAETPVYAFTHHDAWHALLPACAYQPQPRWRGRHSKPASLLQSGSAVCYGDWIDVSGTDRAGITRTAAPAR